MCAQMLSRGSGAACVSSCGRKVQPAAAKPMHTNTCRPRQLLLQHVAPLAQLQCGGAAAEQPSWVVRASETTSAGSSGAPEGQVSAAIVEAMQAKIKDELQADSVVVSDVYGDGRHVSIDVISNIFEGKNSVQRQRMVYKAIWMELQETVHAVDAMTTKTPTEAA